MAKLVRDRIPEIIRSQGKRCTTRILSQEEYLQSLHEKLDEELAEFHKDENLEELADLLEVLLATAQALGHTPEALEQLRQQKAAARGGFREKILLLETEEKQGKE